MSAVELPPDQLTRRLGTALWGTAFGDAGPLSVGLLHAPNGLHVAFETEAGLFHGTVAGRFEPFERRTGVVTAEVAEGLLGDFIMAEGSWLKRAARAAAAIGCGSLTKKRSLGRFYRALGVGIDQGEVAGEARLVRTLEAMGFDLSPEASDAALLSKYGVK